MIGHTETDAWVELPLWSVPLVVLGAFVFVTGLMAFMYWLYRP